MPIYSNSADTGYETLSTRGRRHNPFQRFTGLEKNDPQRFVEGLSFKGKLIGVLEVSEARGDRMCQEALAELKMAVRAAGEHKQRITINVAMDGIRLRDERSTDCLYHHPVHKISFIAQDMTDTRAFGYIFGSPDAGHKFFGIKTEKTASQVVIAMRDLFQVVFELKKKEMEKARSQLEDRTGGEFRESSFSGILGSESGIVSASLTSGAGGAIADLLDLQSELTSLQKGLSQLSQQQQQQQPQPPQNKDNDKADPFGDSFKPPVSGGETRKAKMSTSSCSTPVPLAAPPPLAPPPVSGRHRHDTHHGGTLPHRDPHKQPGTVPPKDNIQQAKQMAAGSMQSSERDAIPKFPVSFPDVIKTPTSDIESCKVNNINEDKYAVFKEFKPTNEYNEYSVDGRFEDEESVHAAGGAQGFDADNFDAEWSRADFSEAESYIHNSQRSHYDVFTDLDPLGTGKVRPYVDKRDFFSEMRKPPPRVLRELGDGEGLSQPSSPRTQPGIIPREVATLVASTSLYCTTPRSSSVMSHSGQLPDPHSISTPAHSAAIPVPGNSFSDSFSPMSDSFGHETFLFRQQSGDQNFYDGVGFTSSEFADFNAFRNESPRSQRSELSSSIPDEPPPPLPCGPLTVALPPESFRDSPPHFSPPPIPHSPGQLPSDPSSPRRYGTHHPAASRVLSKQLTVATSSVSPRTLPRNHKFKKQSSFDNEWREIEYHQRKINMIGDKQMSEGGVSPRPRPRSTLSKQLSASSATLALRSSHNKFSESELSSPEMECKPFPNETLDSSSECAPLPPPRPAHVEPPPLPPKRQPTNIALRPPPPPPTTSDSHYNYINEFDSSPEEPNTTISPPIPIPARKPRHTDNTHPIFIPSRPSKPVLGDSFEYPQTSMSPTSETNAPVHKEAPRAQTPIKSPTPSKSPKLMPKGIASVDLANTSLDQLASSLNVPIEKLARMTVVELAACLAQLQMQQSGAIDDGTKDDVQPQAPEASSNQSNNETAREDRFQNNSIARTEEDVFAKFDAQFPQSPVDPADFSSGNAQGGNESTNAVVAPLGAPVPEDRYAVFRELSTTVTKQKSVFDENFLTPQNSVEDEVSEVSSGTFKANCEPHQDLADRKSSLSEDGEVTELDKDKNWNPEMDVRIDHECVTVFRSPEISEYDNFEPVFDAKFDDEFSVATVSDLGETPINSPLRRHSRHSSKNSADYHISPFTDDFTAHPQPTTTVYKTKPESQSYFAKFEDNFVPSHGGNKNPTIKDLSTNEKLSRIDSLRKSPFEDNFTNEECRERVPDSGFASGFGDSIEKFDDPFISGDSKTRSSSRSSNEFRNKTPSQREHYSLQTPVDNFLEQRKSPFDDDFTNRGDRYEVLKEVESEREPSIEGEISRFNRQDLSPSEESWHASLRNTPYDDQKSIDSLHSIHDEQKSIRSELGFDDEFSRRDSYSSRQRSQSATDYRKNSFGDNYVQTPTEKIQGAYRLRHGSDASSIRQSPFEDNFCSVSDKTSEEVKFDSAFNNTLRGDSENVLQNESQSSRENADPFVVTTTSGENNGGFADFDSAFKQVEMLHENTAPIAEAEALDDPPINEQSDSQTELQFNNNGEELQESFEPEENVFPNDPEPEFKISARYLDQSPDIKKSSSVSIFRRDSDPFADDFFTAEFPEEQKSNQVQNEKSRHTDGDPFWEKPFDSFTFVKEQ
ncbi:unnamed protein product [Meganyctiphanes norvegica]|uniref:PID domain-containing protein n=1 Tax=Meganyctiphanes norvegica TaxID=48144 RepID=A0AAV2RR11_MEGNR